MKQTMIFKKGLQGKSYIAAKAGAPSGLHAAYMGCLYVRYTSQPCQKQIVHKIPKKG